MSVKVTNIYTVGVGSDASEVCIIVCKLSYTVSSICHVCIVTHLSVPFIIFCLCTCIVKRFILSQHWLENYFTYT